MGRLRGLTFFSLAECNEAIALVMRRMNDRPMRSLGLSRRELFEKIERDALIALPADDWEFAEWRRARVNLDYHIEVHDFLYSVPHPLICEVRRHRFSFLWRDPAENRILIVLPLWDCGQRDSVSIRSTALAGSSWMY